MPLHYQIQIEKLEKLEKLEQLEQLEKLEKLVPVQQTTALYLLHRTTYRAPVPVRTTYRCVVLLCARHRHGATHCLLCDLAETAPRTSIHRG